MVLRKARLQFVVVGGHAVAAPQGSFEVAEADFASYDGVLQIGVPPRRIDILNRADGKPPAGPRGRRGTRGGSPAKEVARTSGAS